MTQNRSRPIRTQKPKLRKSRKTPKNQQIPQIWDECEGELQNNLNLFIESGIIG
jgi:hypothetical protein